MTALQSAPTTRRCERLADQLGEALTVVGDVSPRARRLSGRTAHRRQHAGDQAGPAGASCATLTRKYAADIDGVLRWAREARDRLAQLDVSEEALAELAQRGRRAGTRRSTRPPAISPRSGRKAAKALAKEVTAELAGLAMADAEFTIDVGAAAGAARRSGRR